METTERLKQAYVDAEEIYRAAYRRFVWLEHRLYASITESEFDEIHTKLIAQEKQVEQLFLDATQARYKYNNAYFSDVIS